MKKLHIEKTDEINGLIQTTLYCGRQRKDRFTFVDRFKFLEDFKNNANANDPILLKDLCCHCFAKMVIDFQQLAFTGHFFK